MPPRLNIIATCIVMALVNLFAAGQPLASGQWSKFSVPADGVYRIDYSLLKKAGFNPDQVDPAKIRIFSNGTGMLPQANSAPRQNQLLEMAIVVQGESDGKFDKRDAILFFGQGPDRASFNKSSKTFQYEHNLYDDKNFYYITVGAENGKRMANSSSESGTYPAISSFDDFGWYESEQYNILKSGRSWFGEQFSSSTSVTFQFNIPGIVAGSPITVRSRIMGQAFEALSKFNVFYNEIAILEQPIDPILDSSYTIKGSTRSDSALLNADQVNAVTQAQQNIRYQYTKGGSEYSVGYLDNILISLKRKLMWFGTQTIFTSAESLTHPTSTFVINSLPQEATLWDITDPFASRTQNLNFSTDQSTFSTSTSTLKRFIYFIADKALVPTFESAVENQNLSALAAPDLLIISHPDFKSEAERLAAFRRSNNNLSVLIVTPAEIYNEYSGGKQDVTALRDFVRDLSARSGSGLDNLLLFGRCSYDYKNRIPLNTNFVPTYESRNSLDPIETYSSDDYFAFLEASEGTWSEDPAVNHSMDIGVGRIPVVTVAHAKSVVDKLIAYETDKSRFGVWRNRIVLVADDGDYNLHQSSADDLGVAIGASHPEFILDKVYLDQFKQIEYPSGQRSPHARDALQRAIEEGAAIVNFTGHGSENLWMQEEVLDNRFVSDLKNKNLYPIFVTATCEFGRHDDPFQLSNAENLLFQPNGGAIALVTTARPVQAYSNSYLNNAFYQQLFAKNNNRYKDLGTVFRLTKNASQIGVSNRNFSLLGDPTTLPALPRDAVVVMQVKTASLSDTLKAYSHVSIQGEIQTNGARNASFNGDVNITVLDRPADFLTLGDENAPFPYRQWSNTLFRGSVTAEAGKFTTEFVMPKDVAATIAAGKISVYANAASSDASGSFTIKTGGVEEDIVPDAQGPLISLFMGDTTFVDGGIASPNTKLLVRLRDENGISTTSVGGTNQIIAVLDDSLSYNMNSYYTANKDDYKSGNVLFPLNDLPKGRHSIMVQASDTYGNRSSQSIQFIVTDANLVISTFSGYPNPFFTTSGGALNFAFTHNRPGEDLDVELTLVDLTGRPIETIYFTATESYTDVMVPGANFAGNKLSSGVYLCKLSVRSLLDGSKNQIFTKLIIGN